MTKNHDALACSHNSDEHTPLLLLCVYSARDYFLFVIIPMHHTGAIFSSHKSVCLTIVFCFVSQSVCQVNNNN